jgi:hypothetical protein
VTDPAIVNATTSDDQTMLAISTIKVLPFLFFGNASVSFYTNHTFMTTEQLRTVMRSAGMSDAVIDPSKSPRQNLVRQTGRFPDNGANYGYGTSIDFINWNYDREQDTAVQDPITVRPLS